MTTSADLGIQFLAAQQAQPEITHNEALYQIQALSNGVINATTNAPPGSPNEGDSYIVGSSPTGAWAGRANRIAIWTEGGWRFVPGNDDSGTAISMGARQTGLRVYDRAAAELKIWNGSAWVAFSASFSLAIEDEGGEQTSAATSINFVGDGVTASAIGGAVTVTIPGGGSSGSGSSESGVQTPAVQTEAGASYDVAAADNTNYIRMTSSSAKTVNVRPDSVEALPANGEWHFRNVGANDLTFEPDSGVTINPPTDGSLIVPTDGTVTLKRVAEDEFDLFGLTTQGSGS